MAAKVKTKENPYLKRAFLYLPISVMSIMYGILHAQKIYGVSTGLVEWIKYIFLAIPLLLDVILFLTFYTQTFRGSEKLPTPPIKVGTVNSIGYICCIQMFALIVISRYYNLAYALVVACFSAITVISCILMNKKATEWVNKGNPLRQQKVRLELIWPSLYIVALGIISGYFLVISESSSVDVIASVPIVLPMGLATLYAITMFVVDDYKREGKEALHPAHLFFIGALIVLAALEQVVKITLNGKILFPFQNMRLLTWAVVISAVFAQFEAWAVVERRRNDNVEVKRYIRSANVVMVALLFILPVLYIFSYGSAINPFYMVSFGLVGGIYLLIRIWYFHQGAKDKIEYIPNEKRVRGVKIFLTAVCTILLWTCEVLPDNIIVWFTDFLSNDVPLILSILSGVSTFMVVIKMIVNRGESFKTVFNLIFNRSCYETTGNLCMQVLYSSLAGVTMCCIATIAADKYVEEKGKTFPYTLSMACIYYIVMALICLVVIGVEFVKKLNSENADSEERDLKEDIPNSDKDKANKSIIDAKTMVKKTLELLHAPSSAMIFLLIFLPSITNTAKIFPSIAKALPLTFIAMAGFALNNLIDAEKDLINKPKRAIPSGIISKQFAILLCVSLYGVSAIVLFAFSQSLFETLICIAAGIGTIIYSLCAKQIGYVKTLITGLLTITPFLIVFYYYNPKINEFLFIFAVILSTIGKELLMDVRDLSGDAAMGQFTVATLLGERVTQILSVCISSLAIVFYLLSYQMVFSLGLALTSIAIGVLIASYIIWFLCSEHKHEFGIYLLWGVIVICSLPILA